jgi:hypothetical protein
MAPKRRSAGYSPHQVAAKASDLPKILGQELREHYELVQDLPHGMFTLLIELKNLGRPALGTRLAR